MAEYQRFVAYIYEYINGRKSRNAGFAKVESRNGICRIQIHIQDMMSNEGKIEIFGFVRENGALPAVLLGEGQVQNAVLDRKLTTPEETVGGSGYSFDRVGGIWIRSESGRNWATVFDDEPLEIEKLGKTQTDMVQKEIKHEEQQNSTVQKEPELKQKLSEEKVAAETQGKPLINEKNIAAKMEESLKKEEVGADLVEIPAGLAEVKVSSGEAKASSGEATASSGEAKVSSGEAKASSGEAKASSGEAAASSGEATASSEENAAGREKTAAEQEKISGGSEVITAKAEEIALKTGELSEEEKNSAAEEKKTEDTKQAVMKAEKMKETVKETAKETAGCAPHTDKRWNCVTARYPHFQPVSDESIEDAIRIQPSDLRTLWQKGWKQGSNSFLMHGFYQYRYLMLGKCRDGKYVLGVPGIYDEQEQYMAKMFGFSEFKPAGGLQEGRRFGYWCRFLD